MLKLYTMYKYTICLLSKVSLECTKCIKCINIPLHTEVIHCDRYAVYLSIVYFVERDFLTLLIVYKDLCCHGCPIHP